METSLKWVLALVTAVLVIGVIVDFIRHQRRIKQLRVEEDFSDLDFETNDEVGEAVFKPTTFQEPEIKMPLREGGEVNETSISNLEAPTEDRLTTDSAQFQSAGDMLVISVMARAGEVFAGEAFYDALLDAGFHYGKMKIFHRYENVNGTGQKLFSLVSAIEPGTFDIQDIDVIETPGVTLFLSFDELTNPMSSFELMIRTAKQLAFSLNGELFDIDRERLTLQTIEQYRERVRKYQRQQQKVMEDEPILP